MKLDQARLRSALNVALAQPEVAADAGQCEASIDMVAMAGAGESWRLSLWPGHCEGLCAGPAIELRATEQVWFEALSALPSPGRQSLGALRRQAPGFAVEGPELAIVQALPFIERLLDSLRHAFNPLPAPAAADHSGLAFIQGRYLQLNGTDWVYAEQAGLATNPPLLALHTAGADARQWHGLMAQAELRQDWHIHAFDLPAHGRSPLPAQTPNWQWRLTASAYMDWVIGYMDAAGLAKVALLGCSMGSAIGLALLARYPDRFVGALLLEAPYCSPGRRSKYLNHPQVHGARLAAAWVGALLSPTSPKAGRDQATWIYSQGAPGIYDGDLAFYSDDFDAHEYTAAIDNQRTPLYLLTGDYDYSATPADSQRIADEVLGASFSALPGFGHFPMVENPQGLLPFLKAPLQALRQRCA